MEIWVDNFLTVCLFVMLGCWWITTLTWRESLPFAVRLPFALVTTSALMLLVGALVSMVLHFVAMPAAVMSSLSNSPSNLLFYFFESGAETGAFWILIMLIRISLLSHKSFRKC